MTSDEELINDTWPLIRETVEKYKPLLDARGLTWRVYRKPLERQMAFWLALRRMDRERMPEVEAIAREVRDELQVLHHTTRR